MGFLLVDGGEEDDRRALGLFTLADERGRFIAVYSRHKDIQQNDGEILLQQIAQSLFARLRSDDIAGCGEHFADRQQIALIIVNGEDA